jgi:hypothetical protein
MSAMYDCLLDSVIESEAFSLPGTSTSIRIQGDCVQDPNVVR